MSKRFWISNNFYGKLGESSHERVLEEEDGAVLKLVLQIVTEGDRLTGKTCYWCRIKPTIDGEYCGGGGCIDSRSSLVKELEYFGFDPMDAQFDWLF